MSTETSVAVVTAPEAAAAPTPPPAAEAKPPAEAAKPEAEAKPAADPKAAEYWQKRSAEEKRARAKADKIEADRKAFEAERAAHAAKVARADLIDRAKAGDAEAADQLLADGIYDAMTKRALTAKRDTPADKALREIAEMRAQMEKERAEQAKQAETHAWGQTVEGFRQHVTKEAPADYPLLSGELEAEPEYIDAVLRSMDRQARDAGTPITLRDAALKLERYFKDQTDRRTARLRPAPPPAPQTSEQKPRDQRGRFERGDGPRKLTNDLSAERSTPPKGRTDSSRALTMKERDDERRERIRRAANAMR